LANRTRELTAELGEEILPSAASRLELHPLREHLEAAFALCVRADIDLYDTLHVALAAQARGPLVTADEGLVRALVSRNLGGHVCIPGDPEFAASGAV